MIDTNNRYESDCSLIDGKYEYSKIQLEDSKAKYIYIPLSVITDTELDLKRIGIFSYLKIHCGLNDIIGFTIPDMVEWCGGKPDRKINGTNDKFLNMVNLLSNRGYLTYLTDTSRSSFMKCKFNTSYHYQDCSEGFAVVYLDEIEKIMNYKKENSNDNILNNSSILLVFAYLRHKIKRRPNELKPEERDPDGIKKRRERVPDAYDSNIIDIAVEIGISQKTLSKIIDILEYELELIVTDRPYRVKNKDNEFRTLPTIFANAYKRDDKYLLLTGDEYSRNEIKLKAENMKKLYRNYEIDKSKRKTKGGNN